MLKKRTFGRTGIRVSELCLGTIGFGWSTNRETSHQLLDHFSASGGNFIQATSVYPSLPDDCTWTSLSELYLGEWLAANSSWRRDLFVSTRVAINARAGAAAAEHLRQACEASLRKLRIDYIDLMVCQWHTSFSDAEILLQQMTRLVQSGKVRYFGFAGFPLWRVMESVCKARMGTYCRIESFQTDYSLLERAVVEQDVAEMCRERRISLLAASPLAGGYLAARLADAPVDLTERSRRLSSRYDGWKGRRLLSELERISAECNASMGTTALAWVLQNPNVSAALIGVRSKAQLKDALHGSAMELTPAALHALDKASAMSGNHRTIRARRLERLRQSQLPPSSAALLLESGNSQHN